MSSNRIADNNILNESRWARREEVEAASTRIDLNREHYETAGLPVISDTKTAYVDGLDTHSIIFGATGSKKTRLFCMPMINMMIRAGESFIVTDPKGELYAKTSGMAQHYGYDLVVLDFRSIGKGDCWNPLEIPYELYHNGNKEFAISLLNDFIATISSANREKTNDLFWIEMASSLALGNMLLLMECGKKEEANLASFSTMCTTQNIEKIKEVASKISEKTIAGINFKNVFSSHRDTLQSIQVSLFAWVRIFITQKNLTRMLSKNTFDPRSFGKKKTGVYIIVPDEKTTSHFLVTTFVKQVYETLINEAHRESDGKLPVRVNFILDEFCNIPAIPDMPAMISAARSRNMRYFLIVQGMRQLASKYKEDAETIKGNCENWVFLTSKELILLREVSELCGTFTTGNGTTRRLISISELQKLRKERGEALILFSREYPFITELPDIDEYQMYQGYAPSPLSAIEDVTYKTISVSDILKKAKSETILFSDELSPEEIQEIIDKERSELDTMQLFDAFLEASID